MSVSISLRVLKLYCFTLKKKGSAFLEVKTTAEKLSSRCEMLAVILMSVWMLFVFSPSSTLNLCAQRKRSEGTIALLDFMSWCDSEVAELDLPRHGSP